MVRIVFAKPSGFDARIGVVMAWKEYESCLNTFLTRNHGQIAETFTKYESNVLLRKHGSSVDDILTYSEKKSRLDLKNIHEVRVKSLVAQVCETDWFTSYLRNRVDLTLELESSWNGKGEGNVLTYSRREFAVGSQERSRSTIEKSCCANDKLRSDLRNVHEVRTKSLVAQVSETDRFGLDLRNRVDLMLELELS
ncbi:uncharacterized protein G2W53_041231 [Senna tora]|uniref:Uncharacterized protein n=1 Tax=Senna tora TaxID=362788 RepID=A0A834SDD8_9FABA|nr:uncharacterized protein G2W53_041231 [Senna tora]